MQQDEMAELKMEVKSLRRDVEELQKVVRDLQKNGSIYPQRDTSESPAPQRATSRF